VSGAATKIILPTPSTVTTKKAPGRLIAGALAAPLQTQGVLRGVAEGTISQSFVGTAQIGGVTFDVPARRWVVTLYSCACAADLSCYGTDVLEE
jgi:hypothetical protein